MKQIDARPEDYRTQDKRGRWVENIDRKFCRWASLMGVVLCALLAWMSFTEGHANNIPLIVLCYLSGIASGVLLTMSFWPTAR